MVDSNYGYFGAYFMISGIFLAFYGNWKPTLSIFMCAFDYVWMFSGLAFYTLFLEGTPGWANFIANPILAIISCIPPYFMAKYLRIGVAMISAQCGAKRYRICAIWLRFKGWPGSTYINSRRCFSDASRFGRKCLCARSALVCRTGCEWTKLCG